MENLGVFRGVRRSISPPLPALRPVSDSLIRCHVQKSLAHHPQITQRKQRHQVGSVLGQSLVLDAAELPLDYPRRVLNLGTDAGLGLL